VLEVGIVLQVPTPSALPHIWTLKWVYKELGGATWLVKGWIVKQKVMMSIGQKLLMLLLEKKEGM
jgi:hypothetical protein